MSILVATDGEHVPSEPVAVGYDMARKYETDLVVTHVMPQAVFEDFQEEKSGRDRTVSLGGEVSYGQPVGAGGSSERYTIKDAERNGANLARDVVDGTLDEYENVSVQGRKGNVVKELLKEADRRDAEYVVIGGRKRSPAGKALFGSTTQSILLKSDRPVVTVLHSE